MAKYSYICYGRSGAWKIPTNIHIYKIQTGKLLKRLVFGQKKMERGAGLISQPPHIVMSVSHHSINDGVTFIIHTIIHQTQILLCVCAYSRAVGVIQLISLHSSVSYWPSACWLFGWVTASIHQISKDKEKKKNSMYFDPKRLSRGPETKWCQPLPSWAEGGGGEDVLYNSLKEFVDCWYCL